MRTFRIFVLLEQYVEGKNDNTLAYQATKTHVTMLKKKLTHYIFEHLAFAIKRAGWKVTKIHAH